MKNLVDRKFRKLYIFFLFQSFLATISIAFSLIFFNIFEQSAIIVSLGATTYLMFTQPHKDSVSAKHIFGGYFIAIILGILFHKFSQLTFTIKLFPQEIHILISGSLAVGLTIFLSTVFNTEHPPSGGMALALVLNKWDSRTIFLIILALMLLYTIKKLLNPILKDIF